MRVIIAGSRDITNYTALLVAIREAQLEITEVISGGARGVDAIGERYAAESQKPLRVYKADWKKHGRAAGIIRNKVMAENADALIALWDGKSRGTKNMIKIARNKGLKIHVKFV